MQLWKLPISEDVGTFSGRRVGVGTTEESVEQPDKKRMATSFRAFSDQEMKMEEHKIGYKSHYH
uniref:Uncharacterized protein n=1 Tax=Cucumis melo TaxID=3656 RepID=A0A9I9CXK5_CUCME